MSRKKAKQNRDILDFLANDHGRHVTFSTLSSLSRTRQSHDVQVESPTERFLDLFRVANLWFPECDVISQQRCLTTTVRWDALITYSTSIYLAGSQLLYTTLQRDIKKQPINDCWKNVYCKTPACAVVRAVMLKFFIALLNCLSRITKMSTISYTSYQFRWTELLRIQNIWRYMKNAQIS